MYITYYIKYSRISVMLLQSIIIYSYYGQDEVALIHIEKNGLSSLFEHLIVPLMDLRHVIQRVGINREILTNCLNYKIPYLQILHKSLSNILCQSYCH